MAKDELITGELKVPDGAETVRLIREMAVAGTAFEMALIGTPGLSYGLPDVVPVAWNRTLQRLESVKALAEEFRLKPERRKGTAQADTLKSFVELVNRHKTPHSVLFGKCKWPAPALTAVIDYHGTDHAPDWMAHKINYAFPLTDEFVKWVHNNNKPMEQADFAAFIEDHAAELASPTDGEKGEFERLFKERFATPSELITLSRELEVFVGAKAKRGERLQTGERTVEFSAEHLNAKGQKIDIPGVFMVSVPAFVDGDPVRIPARLRYRITGGEIIWFYSLYRWEFWLREQVQRNLVEAAKETDLPSFEGSPEA